jgi:hypothetical protein
LASQLTKEHILRVFENRVLRRIFGPKTKEVAGGWRRLHNEELHNLYTSKIVLGWKEDMIGQPCRKHGRDEKCIQNFNRKTQGEETSYKT